MFYLQNHIIKFCGLIKIPCRICLCQWNILLPNHCVSLILDNICILLLKNILDDTLVKDMDYKVNPWYCCSQYNHNVFFSWIIFQVQYKDDTACDSELKFHSRHDKTFFLMKYSILEKILFHFIFNYIWFMSSDLWIILCISL